MSFVFVGSTGDHAGHSLLTWVLARRLMEMNFRVGFMKPFGTQPVYSEGTWTDRDACLFKEVLNLEEPYDQICPYLISEESWRQKAAGELMEAVKGIALDLLQGKDLLIIMGSKRIFSDDAPFPLPEISFISELKADVVLVHRFRTVSKSIYSALSLSSLLKDMLKGILLNRVPPDQVEEIRSSVISSLSQKGVPITAAVMEDPLLSHRSLAELKEVLNGELLCGQEGLEQAVGGMTVGSGDLLGDLRIFKRAYNKIVLLRPAPPDRDMDESQPTRPVAGIVLTGGRKPVLRLLEAAEKAGIPLIMVKEDAFAVLERLEKTTPHLSPKDEAKVRYFGELLDRDESLASLIRSLDIGR